MGFIEGLQTYIVPFLVVLTVLVFVHELGHYWVARRNGVRVETFSIGFGPELFGFTDRAGTRWKFSLIPLGGYVKMFGDADVTSSTGVDRPLTEDERAVSFHHKRLGQRAAIVAAGPAANFLFALVLFAVLFATAGHPFPPPVVGSVQDDSPAAAAGLAPGDRIVRVDGRRVLRFAEIGALVQQDPGDGVELQVRRDGELLTIAIVPRLELVETVDGGEVEIYRIGVAADTGPYPVLESARLAVTETAGLTWATITSLGEMIVGQRDTADLGGPLRIAQLSGEVAQVGVVALVWLIAILSINLGLINLFPVPMLDGGHLLFYAVEAIRGRPLGERAQEYGFRLGLALVLTLMVFATWNDLVQMKVFAFLTGIIS